MSMFLKSSNATTTLFYCLAGSGMGNSSRFEAVLQSLEETPLEVSVHVFCWGRSFAYLSSTNIANSKNIIIHKMIPYILPIQGGKWDSFITFLMIPFLFFLYVLNTCRLFFETIRYWPQCSIHDSDYHYLPFILLGTPRLAISQSPMVVRNNHFLKSENLKTKINYFLFEYLEYLFTLSFATKILCPSFDKAPVFQSVKIKNITPVVRKMFRFSNIAPIHSVGVFSGGSGIQTDVLKNIAYELDADMYMFSSKDGGYEMTSSDGSLVLGQYKSVVVQAGHVLISESLALQKNVYPVPIANHPEQIVNTKIIQQLFGRSTDSSFKSFKNSEFDPAQLMAPIVFDGADCVVREISQYVGGAP